MQGPQADQVHQPDALRRRPLDSLSGGQVGVSAEPNRPPVSMPTRRPSRRVTAAEMAAIQATYDPNAINDTRRGSGWPPCQCDNPRCPDRRVHHGAA